MQVLPSEKARLPAKDSVTSADICVCIVDKDSRLLGAVAY